MTKNLEASAPIDGAKKILPFGKYLALCICALVVPMYIIYISVGISLVNGAKNNTVEATLSGAANLAAEAVEGANGNDAEIENLLNSVKISANTSAAVIDKTGKLIASTSNFVSTGSLQSELSSRVISGSNGFETIKLNKTSYFVAFAPVSFSNGWSVAIAVPNSDFTGFDKRVLTIYIIISVAFAAYATFGIKRGAHFVSVPLKICIDRMEEMTYGDFSSEIPQIEAHFQEMQSIRDCTEKMRANTIEVIDDISYTLSEMAKGNFAVSSRIPERYVGDYSAVLTAENIIKDELTNTLSTILEISGQVSAGSEQVSNGAQVLAQGAAEQASSIEQLSDNISRVATQINQSAAEAARANLLTEESGEIMQSSTAAMAQASTAMDEISETSRNISKVIKVIEDIAFQTNILALNAAVEAARAGSAGKGFAVVADEVRNLSQKSAEAAKSTTSLLESSNTAVEKGGSLVGKASDDFAQVAEKSAQVSEIVANLSVKFQQQAAETTEISNGIQQVATVVQMNSATSEESAAASEELSSQANLLKSLVAQFRFTDGETDF